MGKIITVTSRKGGVGKTTTLLNLAGVYSNQQKKVLILDLDLYCSGVSISLNLKSDKTIYNLILDITNHCFTEVDDYVIKYNEFISVLPSLKDPRQVNHIGINYIEQVIQMLRHSYDLILIDTSHILNDLNVLIYDNSDTILNIMNNNPVDLVNTKNFITICENVEFPDLRILLNESNSLDEKYFSMYDISSFLGRDIPYYLGKNFFVKAIDKYVVEGQILTLNKGYYYEKKEYKVLEKIALDLLDEKE